MFQSNAFNAGTGNPWILAECGWAHAGAFEMINIAQVGNVKENWSNYSTRASYVTAAVQAFVSPVYFIGLRNDGTTLYWQYSTDGINWLTLYSIAASSSYLGSGNQTSIACAIQNNTDGQVYHAMRAYNPNALTESFP